jgi:hypothetical protein
MASHIKSMDRPCVARGLLQVGRETVRINLSGLSVEHLLRAIMGIRAHRACLKPRPQGAIFIPRLPVRRATVHPSCHILLANLGRMSIAAMGSGRASGILRIISALAGQHAPSHAGELVGQGRGEHIPMQPRSGRLQPAAEAVF